MEESKSSTSYDELKPIMDYHILKSIKSSLSDEAILDYIKTQNISVSSSEEFKEYYSKLEKQVKSLISSNSDARTLYLKLINDQKSIESQIKDVKNYKKRDLKKKFRHSLIHAYKAARDLGFRVQDREVKLDFNQKDELIIIFPSEPSIKISFGRIAPVEYGHDSISLGQLFNKYWNYFIKDKYDTKVKRIIDLEEDIQLFLDEKNNNLKEIFGEK